MANPVCDVLLTEARLDVSSEYSSVSKSFTSAGETGAIVDFWGIVRSLEDGREIEGIKYEAHVAMAEHQLRLVAQSAATKFGLNAVILYHRFGFVAAGEASLFVQVGALHRAAAFEASKWIVDELKKKVPIWKRPRFRIDSREQPRSELLATTR